MRYRLLSFILIVLLFASCEKKNEDFLYISVTPTSEYGYKNSDELISFNITISSSVTMSELRIIEKKNSSYIDTLVLKDINGTNINESLLYRTPNSSINDTSLIQLFFYCKDINGKTAESSKTFYVVSSAVFLTETTGHTMFSTASSSFNAYDLLNGIPTDCHSGVTSHINDEWPYESDTLSRKWTSLDSELIFTKVNSFNYANATAQDLQQTYDSSIKKEFVDDIQADDIIITLIDNTYIAIKLIYVIDDIGVENDRYIFSIKK